MRFSYIKIVFLLLLTLCLLSSCSSISPPTKKNIINDNQEEKIIMNKENKKESNKSDQKTVVIKSDDSGKTAIKSESMDTTEVPKATKPAAAEKPKPTATIKPKPTAAIKPKPSAAINPKPSEAIKKQSPNNNNESIQVVAQPHSIPVLINKTLSLPENFKPQNLVYPNVAFIFSEKNEKRMLRKEAATALEQLFIGAKKDGVTLLGVSAYRSYATQKALFDRYVAKDGYEKARTYSALPGTSEHQTGLAIDVTGGDGKCAAEDCFGGTKEAVWLDQHASQYGYIIRYPKGKENITGYKYEPWHLRYVGKDVAATVSGQKITLEEYFNVVPVSK
ncbi:MAG: D-alanyl-D-alanine carboxypeptidase family protein [Bacillota bacterium]